MRDYISMVYGFDFSSKENYPIKDHENVIEFIIDRLYSNYGHNCYDIDNEIISCPYSGYGDNNYYIGYELANTEEDSAKQALLNYDNILKEQKIDLDNKINTKLDSIISELKNCKNEDSVAFGIPEDYAEFGAKYFENLKGKQAYIEVEATD